MFIQPSISRLLCLALCSLAPGLAHAQGTSAASRPKPAASPRPAAPENDFRVPSFRPFADRHRQYVLTEPFKYFPPQSREPIIVPAGFVTDFASIPGPLSVVFGPSVHDLPALVHDYLYWRQSCTREQADRLFDVALNLVGVSKGSRMAIALGLRLGGPSAYRGNAQERRERLPRIVPSEFMRIPVTTWDAYRKDLRRRGVALDTLDTKPPEYCRG
jgi:hypothetical protein